MPNDTEVEQEIARLVKLAHPQDQGKSTEILEQELRATLHTFELRGERQCMKRSEGYEQGYTQGKFDEKMDAEYKHPEELQKARHDWLREEIVKLKGMEVTIREDADTTGYNFALQTIIDRYQAEVDQDKALQDKK